MVTSFLVTVTITRVKLPKAPSVSKMNSWPSAPVKEYRRSGERSVGCVSRKARVWVSSEVGEGLGFKCGILVVMIVSRKDNSKSAMDPGIDRAKRVVHLDFLAQ